MATSGDFNLAIDSRDGVDPSKRLVYQVKWSVTGQEKDPVAWLDAEIRSEFEKIKRFASEGTRRYVLVTNVQSTGKPKSGTFDRLNAKLDAYSKDFELEMSCIWREALNPMVDSAPAETKWAYADMLAGWRMSRVPWNFGGGPMIIRLRSRFHHDGRHRQSARRHAAGGRLAALAGAGGR